MYDFMLYAKILNEKYPLYRSKEHNASYSNTNVTEIKIKKKKTG